MYTSIESDVDITSIANSLRADMARLAQGEAVGDSGLRAPRLGGAEDKATSKGKSIARILFPNEDADRRVSYVRYGQTIAKLRRAWLKQQEDEKLQQAKNPQYRQARILGQRATFEALLDAPVSFDIANPTPMPVTVAPESELLPIFDHMRSGLGTTLPCQEFDRGAIYNDGRIDVCKQVVGPPFVEDLTLSVTANSNVRHFLIGNNVVGDHGAKAIAKMVQSRSEDHPIETLYLAGNCFTDVGAKTLGKALARNRTVASLWLKRNPLGPDGVEHLAEMLRENTTLATLDLVNTATGDAGVKTLFAALRENSTLKTLYLDANAITPKGCEYIAEYFEHRKSIAKAGLTGLFLTVNRIGDEGAAILVNSISGYLPIVRLDLGSNRIQNTGLEAILKSVCRLTNLDYLGLGLHKSTSDLGELPNYFDGLGAELLADFLKGNPVVKALDLDDVNLRPTGWPLILSALQENSNLLDLKFSQLGFKMPQEISEGIQEVLERNVKTKLGISREEFREERLRYIKHTEQVRYIDSIYRNNM